MEDLRYETHIPSDPLLPFVIYSGMDISATRFNPIPNWHDDMEILNCKTGEGYIIMDGKQIGFSAGDTILVRPLVIHNVFSQSSVRFSVITPKRDFCSANGIETDQLMYPEKIRDNTVDRLSDELERYNSSNTPLRIAKIRRTILDIMIHLTEKYGLPAKDFQTEKKSEFLRVQKAMQFISDNYTIQLSLYDIAKNVGINKFTLARNFKELTGMTIVSYLNKYRCLMARERIYTGMSIKESAEQCVFSNMSYFSKTFLKHIGKLPSQSKGKSWKT